MFCIARRSHHEWNDAIEAIKVPSQQIANCYFPPELLNLIHLITHFFEANYFVLVCLPSKMKSENMRRKQNKLDWWLIRGIVDHIKVCGDVCERLADKGEKQVSGKV